MTDEEFEIFADKVDNLLKGASKRPLAYAIVIVPNSEGAEDPADSLAVYGTRDAIDEQRHALVDALDMLSTNVEREHPRPPPPEGSN